MKGAKTRQDNAKTKESSSFNWKGPFGRFVTANGCFYNYNAKGGHIKNFQTRL